ncbi:MAG: DUF2461 domain-containing protein [Flavobacteriales bacterium]|nr:DUF2461 domain-containing protein [Flavobacteriales bacterium]
MSASPPRITPSTLAFLSDLDRHNDRDWFQANKPRYATAHTNVKEVVEALIERMKRHDRLSTDSARESLMRIHNDLRFHKDRPPYSPRFAGSFSRVKPALRGGYYYHFAPGGSFLACGFWGPEPADLRRIRSDIAYDPATWKRLLNNKRLKATFGDMQGEQLRTAPQGFAKDHPAIDLLRYKQYLFRHPLTDKEVMAPDLVEHMDTVYRAIRPFFDHMSEVLTTDANGQ